MRDANPTPSLVPTYDVTVYIVLDSFGRLGRAYRETDEAKAELDDVIENLLAGEFNSPVRIVAFNTAEGWSRDVSEDIAWEVIKRQETECKILPTSTRDFVEYYVGERTATRELSGVR
jgi:hypothetical protein